MINENASRKYCYGLDIIRVIAMFLVISVHATTFYGFESQGVYSHAAFFVGMSRFISYACVPLFIMLTGYLNSNQTPSLKFYVKIIRILIEFFICGVVIFIFNRVYLKSEYSFLEFVSDMIDLSYPQYSWYIAMYVGLFLIAPFFNYIIKAINGKQKIMFSIILLLVFSMPNITDWWISAYPIMYYFFGAFIKDIKFRIKRIWLILIILACSATQVLVFMYPIIPRYGPSNHMNLGCVIITTAIFLLFKDLCGESRKTPVTKALRTVANASLSTYLVSEIFESLTAEYFNALQLTLFSEKLPYLIYLTPIKFILSVMCGILINISASYIFKGCSALVSKIKVGSKAKTEA